MKVYKFRGGSRRVFKRDLECLSDNNVWYSKLADLNDPLEGSVDDEYLRVQVQNLNGRFRASNKNVREDAMKTLFSALDGFLKRREKVGIYALSTDFRNESLWAYYGCNHEGFCIEYDLEQLVHSFKQEPIYQTKVKYAKERPKLETKDLDALRKGKQENLIQKLLGTKSQRWGSEEEIRLISDYPGLNRIKAEAVTAVYFGHGMTNSRKRKVIKELSGRNLVISLR